MNKKYLTLSDGRKISMIFNLNVVAALQKNGIELQDFAKNPGDVLLILKLAFYSAQEGESSEGRQLELDERQFGRLLDMKAIKELNSIFYSWTGSQN